MRIYTAPAICLHAYVHAALIRGGSLNGTLSLACVIVLFSSFDAARSTGFSFLDNKCYWRGGEILPAVYIRNPLLRFRQTEAIRIPHVRQECGRNGKSREKPKSNRPSRIVNMRIHDIIP